MNTHNKLVAELKAMVSEYPNNASSFFNALNAPNGGGLSSAQFDTLRVNYLYRIETSAWAVASVIRAALAQDPPDLITAKHTLFENLLDELGGTKKEAPHLDLLVSTLNIYGAIVHKLEPMKVADTANSRLLVPKAEPFRRVQKSLYSSSSFATILGASFAQESVAKVTLQRLRSDVFNLARHRGSIDPVTLDRIDLYFAVHLDEIFGSREEEHSRVALEQIERICNSSGTRAEASQGCKEFLTAHVDFFNEVGNRLQTIQSDVDGQHRATING